MSAWMYFVLIGTFVILAAITQEAVWAIGGVLMLFCGIVERRLIDIVKAIRSR